MTSSKHYDEDKWPSIREENDRKRERRRLEEWEAKKRAGEKPCPGCGWPYTQENDKGRGMCSSCWLEYKTGIVV